MSISYSPPAGAGDDAVLFTSKENDINASNIHYIETVAGTADVFVSLDGTNFNVTPVAVLLADDVTTGGGVKVTEIAAGKIGILTGAFKAFKVQQKGAVATTVRVTHGRT